MNGNVGGGEVGGGDVDGGSGSSSSVAVVAGDGTVYHVKEKEAFKAVLALALERADEEKARVDEKVARVYKDVDVLSEWVNALDAKKDIYNVPMKVVEDRVDETVARCKSLANRWTEEDDATDELLADMAKAKAEKKAAIRERLERVDVGHRFERLLSNTRPEKPENHNPHNAKVVQDALNRITGSSTGSGEGDSSTGSGKGGSSTGSGKGGSSTGSGKGGSSTGSGKGGSGKGGSGTGSGKGGSNTGGKGGSSTGGKGGSSTGSGKGGSNTGSGKKRPRPSEETTAKSSPAAAAKLAPSPVRAMNIVTIGTSKPAGMGRMPTVTPPRKRVRPSTPSRGSVEAVEVRQSDIQGLAVTAAVTRRAVTRGAVTQNPLRRDIQYHCEHCRSLHSHDENCAKRKIMDPFSRKHGLQVVKVVGNGDCFYLAIRGALGLKESVGTLRGRVADNVDEEVFASYKAQSHTEPHLRKVRGLTIDEFRAWVRAEGAFVGADKCVWADEHAFKVISHGYDVGLLVIDVQRAEGASPYRIMHGSKASPARYVVLVSISVGHFDFIKQVNGSGAFLADQEMPDVLRKLFKLKL